VNSGRKLVMKKNITLSADDELIRKARERALRERTTLNDEFRKWLRQYTRFGISGREYERIMNSMDYAKPGRRFNREDMNER